jgi:hypothetical protein
VASRAGLFAVEKRISSPSRESKPPNHNLPARSQSLYRLSSFISYMFIIFLKALTLLRGPLAYPNGLLDLHIETFGRTPWPGD